MLMARATAGVFLMTLLFWVSDSGFHRGALEALAITWCGPLAPLEIMSGSLALLTGTAFLALSGFVASAAIPFRHWPWFGVPLLLLWVAAGFGMAAVAAWGG